MPDRLDAYEFQARFSPGLLAVLPVSLTILGLGLESSPFVSGVLGLLSAAGAPFLLSDIVRARGLSLERELYEAWGGPPTTYLLRLRERASNPVLQDRWRQSVSNDSGVTLLDAAEERDNPEDADNRIEAAVAGARERSRDSETYKLVAAENRHYGFNRNLLGMRRLGIAVALVGFVVSAVALAGELLGDDEIHSGVILGLLANGVWLIGWWVVPSVASVRRAAEKYAAQLFNSVTSA